LNFCHIEAHNYVHVSGKGLHPGQNLMGIQIALTPTNGNPEHATLEFYDDIHI